MLSKIKDIAQTAAAFLQQGVAPPNTPEDQKEKLSGVNHLSSKKFFLAFSGFVILGVFFVVSIAILYSMNQYPLLLPSYTLIFTKTIEVFATIMAVYIGGQAIVDLKYNSSSNVSSEAQQISSYQKIDITKTIAIEKEEDYTLEVDE
jgi:hypothetical protein